MNDDARSIDREPAGPPVALRRDAIVQRLLTSVSAMIEDWGRDRADRISEDTLLVADLGFQSLDIVVLMGDISQQLNRRDLPFERLFLTDGRPIADLSLGALADFLWGQVRDARVTVAPHG